MDNPTAPAIVLVSGAPVPPALSQILREAFADARLFVAATEPALRGALAGGADPLLICDLGPGGLPLDAIARLLLDLSSPARVLGLAPPDAAFDRVQAMARGARDVVSLKEPLHLMLVVARELGVLPAWRARHAALLGARTEEPASALMEGEELAWANEPFARLLGRSSSAQIARRALWVCIDGEDHHILRRALHSVAAGHSRPAAPLVLRAMAPDGRRLRLAFTLAFEREGDKPVVRINAAPAQAAEGGERAPAQLNVDTLKRLRAAISANGLAIAVQPISPLAGPEGADAERLDVLIRIKDAAGEMAAAEFMREASASGLLKAMDQWIVRHACAMAAKHAGKGEALYFLRIARQTLQDPATLGVVRGAIATHRVLPSHLSFEMSESEFITLFPDERALLYALKKDGCRLTLSQFGARPESLETLERLPLDYIKLDHKLTAEASTSEPARVLLRQIVQKAAARNTRTISTRVVDATSLAELWKLGVNFVQGYYVHEPEIVVGA